MVELISAVLGLSFASGLNAYATVLGLGLMHRLGWIHLPPGLELVGTTPVIAVAAVFFVIEFFADKIPYVDSLWDGLHTVVRPAAGALLAYGAVGNVDAQWQALAALAGGSMALTSHMAKTSSRAAANTSPEPFSNWFLSLFEDALSLLLVWLTGSHPLLALTVVLLLGVIAVFIVWKFARFVRRVFFRMRTTGL